jgi:uracil-DNA glycosylase
MLWFMSDLPAPDHNGPRDPSTPLGQLAQKVRACQVCAAQLPLGPRPILRVDERLRVLITGQAPGTRVHATGLPWNDPSGDRLRDWLGVDRDRFYALEDFGVMAMGFCYPGRGRGGDLPPRPECAPLWHAQIRARLPRLRLTLLIGRYAQIHYLGTRAETLEATVRRWADFTARGWFPLPHPSPRNMRWLQQRPWFETEVIPALRAAVQTALADQ